MIDKDKEGLLTLIITTLSLVVNTLQLLESKKQGKKKNHRKRGQRKR